MSEQMTADDKQLWSLWEAIFALAKRVGMHPIKDRLWDQKIDQRWRIIINGTKDVQVVGHAFELHPCNMYVEFNGWPAGILSPYEGTICAGSLANIDTLTAAIRRACGEGTK